LTQLKYNRSLNGVMDLTKFHNYVFLELQDAFSPLFVLNYYIQGTSA